MMCYFTPMQKLVLLGIVLGFAACGGKVEGDDSGTGPGSDAGTGLDAVAKKDAISTSDVGPPTPSCTPIQSQGAVGTNGECQISDLWSCGDTKYSIQCNCPAATCDCTEQTANGGGGTTVSAVGVCPACSDSASLPALCGFPH